MEDKITNSREVDELFRHCLMKYAFENNKKEMLEQLKNKKYPIYSNKEMKISRNKYGRLYIIDKNHKILKLDFQKINHFINTNKEQLILVEFGIKEKWDETKTLLWSKVYSKIFDEGFNNNIKNDYTTLEGTPIYKIHYKNNKSDYQIFLKEL